MATEKEIMELRGYLLRKFTKRNETYQELRKFYNSDYHSSSEVQGIRLVYNLLADAVDRYTDFMIQPPDWRVVPMGSSTEELEQADKEEKFLYSQYGQNFIHIIQGWIANLQAMLGMFAIEARPVFENPQKVVQLDIPVPDYVLPLPKSDNVMDLESVIILGDIYSLKGEQFQPDFRPDQRIQQTNITKFYDKNMIQVLKDGKEIWRVEHNFGFIPIVIGQNRIKPHYIEGTGDMDRGAGLQKYLNDLLGWQADIIEYAANPITIIKGYNGDNLPVGPRAQWHLGKDMDASFLTWPGQAPTVENMLQRVQSGIEDSTLLGEPLNNRNIPSGTSNSAVRSLLSGVQAAFLRKQVMLGLAYTRMNEIILRMTEHYFKDKEIIVRGTKKNNTFATKMKGSEIAGNYLTQAIFPPGILDQASRIDLELAKMNARIQSRYTTMENTGVQSPKDELELIRMEQEEELEREMIRQGGALPPGVDRGQANEMRAAADQLARMGPGTSSGQEQPLIEAISKTPRVKGDVLFAGREGNLFVIALSDMRDKATIVNRLPQEFKGKVKFRAIDERADAELLPIIEQQEAPVK